MAVVAVFVAVLLSALGINRIGGETWTSAANAVPGWRAYSGTVTPPPAPVLRAFLVPAAMILAVIAVAALAALLKRYAGTANAAQPNQGEPFQTPPRSTR